MKKLFCLLLAAFILLPMLPACQKTEQSPQSATDNAGDTPEDEQAGLPEQDDQSPQEPEHDPDAQPAPEPVRICLTAVGDNLLHNTVSTDCKTADGSLTMCHYTTISRRLRKKLILPLLTRRCRWPARSAHTPR